jgi:hypothetical protein
LVAFNVSRVKDIGQTPSCSIAEMQCCYSERETDAVVPAVTHTDQHEQSSCLTDLKYKFKSGNIQ